MNQQITFYQMGHRWGKANPHFRAEHSANLAPMMCEITVARSVTQAAGEAWGHLYL